MNSDWRITCSRRSCHVSWLSCRKVSTSDKVFKCCWCEWQEAGFLQCSQTSTAAQPRVWSEKLTAGEPLMVLSASGSGQLGRKTDGRRAMRRLHSRFTVTWLNICCHTVRIPQSLSAVDARRHENVSAVSGGHSRAQSFQPLCASWMIAPSLHTSCRIYKTVPGAVKCPINYFYY